MTPVQVLSLISFTAFLCCQACSIIFLIALRNRETMRRIAEREAEREAEYNRILDLTGEEFNKAIDEYIEKYCKDEH